MTNQYWHVITKRPMTEEERKELSEMLGYDVKYEDAFIYDNLPEDGQAVFIKTTGGYVGTDYFCEEDGILVRFEDHDMDEVTAWMPLMPLSEPFNPEGGQE